MSPFMTAYVAVNWLADGTIAASFISLCLILIGHSVLRGFHDLGSRGDVTALKQWWPLRRASMLLGLLMDTSCSSPLISLLKGFEAYTWATSYDTEQDPSADDRYWQKFLLGEQSHNEKRSRGGKNMN